MYETIVESWRNLQSFREMAELIGRSIDLHYTLSLSLSFHFLDNSSFIRARPPWREEAAGSGPKRGKEEERWKKDWMESMNRSLSPFSFFRRPKERASSTFQTFQTRHDALGSRCC